MQYWKLFIFISIIGSFFILSNNIYADDIGLGDFAPNKANKIKVSEYSYWFDGASPSTVQSALESIAASYPVGTVSEVPFLRLDTENDPLTNTLSTQSIDFVASETYDVGSEAYLLNDLWIGDNINTNEANFNIGTSDGATDCLNLNVYSQGTNRYLKWSGRSENPIFTASGATVHASGCVVRLDDSPLIVSDYFHLGVANEFDLFLKEDGDARFSGEFYATKGVNAVTQRYGTGLQVRESALTKTLIYNIDATFTAATATIEKIGETFVSDGVIVGDFLVVTNASIPAYTGSTGEVIGVTETTIIVSIAAAGTVVPDDLTNFDFYIYNHPLAVILDNGDVHFLIGSSPDAIFHIKSDYGASPCAFDLEAIAGSDGHNSMCIHLDADTYTGVSVLGADLDVTAFDAADDIATVFDVAIDNTGLSTIGAGVAGQFGEIHALDVALTETTASGVIVAAVATHEGVDVIHQHIGSPVIVTSAWEYDGAFNDRTTAFESADTNVQIFDSDNDYILLASTAKWDEINVILSIVSSQDAQLTFEYIEDDGDWVVFGVADDTGGFVQSGTIRFDSDNLTTWGVRTISEVTGETGEDDYYWIRITRTRNFIVTPPTESTIKITATGTEFYWDSDGDAFTNTIALTDGITEPDTIEGQAIIYVDTATGNLMCKFGDGFTATLAVDQ